MDYEAMYARVSEQNLSLREDMAVLKARIDGDIPEANSRLQMKVSRQRQHLARLEKRVVAQRFILRTLDKLGRSLTAEERAAALETDPKRELVDAGTLQKV